MFLLCTPKFKSEVPTVTELVLNNSEKTSKFPVPLAWTQQVVLAMSFPLVFPSSNIGHWYTDQLTCRSHPSATNNPQPRSNLLPKVIQHIVPKRYIQPAWQEFKGAILSARLTRRTRAEASFEHCCLLQHASLLAMLKSFLSSLWPNQDVHACILYAHVFWLLMNPISGPYMEDGCWSLL